MPCCAVDAAGCAGHCVRGRPAGRAGDGVGGAAHHSCRSRGAGGAGGGVAPRVEPGGELREGRGGLLPKSSFASVPAEHHQGAAGCTNAMPLRPSLFRCPQHAITCTCTAPVARALLCAHSVGHRMGRHASGGARTQQCHPATSHGPPMLVHVLRWAAPCRAVLCRASIWACAH